MLNVNVRSHERIEDTNLVLLNELFVGGEAIEAWKV
jgi:hypothetical protein